LVIEQSDAAVGSPPRLLERGGGRIGHIGRA
jgi:hypothetical protein